MYESFFFRKCLLLVVAYPCILFSQTPAYYSGIDFSRSSENIKTQLTTLITNTQSVLLPYTSSSLDTWDVLVESDLESQFSDEVLLIYGYDNTDLLTSNDYSRNKDLSCHSSSCLGLWNREHVFSKSLADPSLVDSYPSAGTDVHNLRACDSQMNSSRNNRIFQDGTGNSHITSLGNFFPGNEWKGDVARIIMYMFTRYPEQCEAKNIGFGDLDETSTMPAVFLAWNAQDLVSQYERGRNESIYSVQGNRNPYIDNPYLATLIWGGELAEDTWGTLGLKGELKESFAIYPTYTKDYVYIDQIGNYNKYNFVIINALGQRVMSSKLEHMIDISSLDAGVYIMKVQGGKAVITQRIIKS
ncbi:endonuclease [Algibacter lectus]|uniref:endonuclease n=1 Tax=Algibacter lectus TaxID=221126 RepID=UPI0026F05BAE|nr:endonuclease [Algibacter lectus]MDO7138673.1 endonuclease [Algibacter lectus]